MSATAPELLAGRPARRTRGRSDLPAAGALWFPLTATLLSGVAPLLLMQSTPLGRESSDAWVWAWALTVVVGLRYAWLVAEGRRRLFEVVFWLFAYVFLGLAPLVQMRSGVYPGTTPDIDLTLNGTTMAVVVVGCAAFAVGGSIAAVMQRPQARRSSADDGVPAASRVRLLTVGALLFSAYYVSQVGVGTVFSSRSARSDAQSAVWPIPPVSAVVAAAATLPLVVAFAALMQLRRVRRAEGRSGPWLLLLLVALALGVLVNPISNPRYVAGTAALSVIVALGAVATDRRMRSFAVVLAVGLVLVFPYADIARYAGQTGSDSRGGPAEVLSSPDFDAFDQINNALAYVDEAEPVPGRQLLGAALFFVPRSLWPGKPEDTGVVLADFRGYAVTNLSAPLWAEAFVNGGWVGLVVLMGAVGIVVRRFDERVDAVRPRPPRPGVIATTIPFYAIIMFRGSLLQSMAGFTVLLVCGLFVSAPARTGQDA